MDASRLSFPLQLVIWLVTTLLTVAGGIWGSTYGLRSDVRDILTRQEMQAEVDKVKAELEKERAAAIKDALGSVQRKQDLHSFEIQAIKDALMERGIIIRRGG